MANPFEQHPFDGAEFIENPEQRCPCLLILDVSASMRGRPIAELNEGLRHFQEALSADSLASRRVEIAIITFGPVQVLSDFESATRWSPPTLSDQGDTPMGAAIEAGLNLLRDRKNTYQANGISYYRPWIFLITDGEPTDAYARAAALIKNGENERAFSFFAVGVEGANLTKLSEISQKAPLALRGLMFRELFAWLSSSLSAVSRSTPGDLVPLQNPTAPDGWASV
jgi:uncharacterized protein YegL